MRKHIAALGLGACLAVASGGLAAADPASAERKIEILEEKASPEGDDRPPKRREMLTPGEGQVVDPHGSGPLDDALTCLARSIYWESKGENGQGMEAVANVVMNRLSHEGFPNTVCEVVKQGQENGSCQFSWWCDGRSDRVEESEQYAVAKEIARRALNGQLPDNTSGALYFHHQRLSPAWSKKFVRTAQVGDHIFYRPDAEKLD